MEKVLSSGLTVFHLPAEYPPTHAVGILIPRGAFADPPGREGLYSLLTHLLLKSMSDLGPEALQAAWDRLGTVAEAAADSEYTLLSMEALEPRFEEALGLLVRAFDQAVIPEKEFALARKSMRASLHLSCTDPDYVTEAHLFAEAFGAEHPLGRPATRKTLNSIRIPDLQCALSALRQSPRWAAFIATPAPVASVLPMLARAAGLWRISHRPPPPWPALRPAPAAHARLIPRKGMTQVCLQALLPVPARPAPEYLPLRLSFYSFAEGGFSARLMRRLRVELGSTYGISGAYKALKDFGYMHLSTMVSREQAPRARTLILEEYERWRTDGPTPDELDEARQYSLKAFPMIQDNPLELGALLLKNHLHGLPSDFVETYPERLRSVTLDDVRTAHRTLPSSIPAWAAAGERDTLRACFSGLEGAEERGWTEF